MNNFKLRKLFLPLVTLLLLLSSCNLENSSKNDSIKTETPGTETPGTETPGTETPGTETPVVKPLKSIGTWDGEYEKVIFTETTYSNYYYFNGSEVESHSGEIVKYVNDSFNTSSESNDEMGYIVVLFKGGSGDGKYGVLRWKELRTVDGVAYISYSEGYKRLKPDDATDYSGIYFDSAEAAETGMDDTFFGRYSTLTEPLNFTGSWKDNYGTYNFSDNEFGGTGTNGTIVKITNTRLRTGYFVFKYTKSYTESLLGNYGVVRWKNLTKDSVKFSEGYKVSNPEETDWTKQTPIIFTTAEAAENGMDDTFFGMYSTVNIK